MKYLPYLIVFFFTFSCSKEEETDSGLTSEEKLDEQFRAANRLAVHGIQITMGPEFDAIEKVAFDFSLALNDCKNLGINMSQAGFAWNYVRRELEKPYIEPSEYVLKEIDESLDGTIDDFKAKTAK